MFLFIFGATSHLFALLRWTIGQTGVGRTCTGTAKGGTNYDYAQLTVHAQWSNTVKPQLIFNRHAHRNPDTFNGMFNF